MARVLKIVALVLGVAASLLGGLWLAQGLGLVRIEPIACVAECAPLEGPSPTWAALGACMLAAGLAAIVFSLRRSSKLRGKD